MNAVTLLADLEAVGIHVSREGDNLKVRGEPGVSLTPYLERIKPHKPTLLRELLQRQIIVALDVAREDFNRTEYDRLWVLWHAQDVKETT